MLNDLKTENWIYFYICWEFSLIKELGFEINLLNEGIYNDESKNSIKINNKSFKIPKILSNTNINKNYKEEIKEALIFNKNLLLENFITPNSLKMPFSRNILENYYT